MDTVEDLRQSLATGKSAVRVAALEQLHQAGPGSLSTDAVVPVLAEHFARDNSPKQRRLTARLIVRFAGQACHVPGLAEELARALAKARTRDETYAALVFLRIAAEKGWDLSAANPVLIDTCPTAWGQFALDALVIQADRGVDVLDCRGTGGLEFWEVLKLLLEFQAGRYEIRLRVLRIILASGRYRSDHLAYYAEDVEGAAADGRMSEEFRQVAAACWRMTERWFDAGRSSQA